MWREDPSKDGRGLETELGGQSKRIDVSLGTLVNDPGTHTSVRKFIVCIHRITRQDLASSVDQPYPLLRDFKETKKHTQLSLGITSPSPWEMKSEMSATGSIGSGGKMSGPLSPAADSSSALTSHAEPSASFLVIGIPW
jgi:hypothetical protein